MEKKLNQGEVVSYFLKLWGMKMNVFPFLPCGWSYCALRSSTQDLPSAPLSPSPLLNVLKAPMGGGGRYVGWNEMPHISIGGDKSVLIRHLNHHSLIDWPSVSTLWTTRARSRPSRKVVILARSPQQLRGFNSRLPQRPCASSSGSVESYWRSD